MSGLAAALGWGTRKIFMEKAPHEGITTAERINDLG